MDQWFYKNKKLIQLILIYMNMIIYAKNKNKIPIIIQNIFNNN